MIRRFPIHRLRTAAARWQGRRQPGSAAFVRALVAPYRRRDSARGRLPLTMLVRRAAMVTSLAERHLHVRSMQHWRVQLVVNRLAAGGTSQSRNPVTPFAARVDHRPPALGVAAPVLVRWSMLPARLIARATRIDRASPTSSPLAPRTPALAGQPARLESRDHTLLTVVRSAAAAAVASTLRATTTAAAHALTATEARAGTVTPLRAPSLPVLDHSELQRLTSRVISSIDDRIAAARERLGSA
jgi:hypothetical protein